MNFSSRSVSRRTGGGLRAASFTRYALFSVRGFTQWEKDLERWRPDLHIKRQNGGRDDSG
jgi:hypothetical protein